MFTIVRFAGPSLAAMNSITVTLMTYGADLGEMIAGAAAAATLYLTLRKPKGKHQRRRGRT